ncbi:MAG: DNA-formamidopyrimidine glycosylase family protein [Armatimonadota bacterium]
MPEGPEVRRYADSLHGILAGKQIHVISARTKAAKKYLAENEVHLTGKRIERVFARGKNLIGLVENQYYFYSHLMMWGRWDVRPEGAPSEVDRRERARIVVADGSAAILLSAPIFEVGQGDPLEEIEPLRLLGPDILPYPGTGPFDQTCFRERLQSPINRERAIGAVLLDQTVAAGIGNYLRAEMLFLCRMDPFALVSDLSEEMVAALCEIIPLVAARAYAGHGTTVTDDDHRRMADDRSLLYPNASPEWGSRHYVFRRTNLPCLVCGEKIRQKRQVTRQTEEGEDKERIIFFCPNCQNVEIARK